MSNPQRDKLVSDIVKKFASEAPLSAEGVDWSDPKAKISKYFTVKEATLLPSWGIYHTPSEDEKKNIWEMAQSMDIVREFLTFPIMVHVWIRPSSVNCPGNPRHGQDYNAFVKGAAKSAHRLGKAVDWSCPGKICDDIRKLLEPKLKEFGLRMEDLPKSNWVHLDNMPVAAGKNHFFKP